mmetsp:Transcript_23976/g.71921  ORF Transcript_23976/g.71921 Transcript_23976/m.71921 type:complete len:217 (-) Transcript_23976:311-961(-)
MAVMLSSEPAARALFVRSEAACCGSSAARTIRTTCSLSKTSKSPSDARTTNSSLSSSGSAFTSGTADTYGLRNKSPMARDIARIPIARQQPMYDTNPPSASILRRSAATYRGTHKQQARPPAPPAAGRLGRSRGRPRSRLNLGLELATSGLWSSVIGTAAPPRQSTPRESPTWATVSTVGSTRATTAVVPSERPSRSARARKSRSTSLKACSNPAA